MKSKSRVRLWSAAFCIFSIALSGTLDVSGAALADDGSAVQQEMDRFGIRPAERGEETVTGQTAGDTAAMDQGAYSYVPPHLVFRKSGGNYVFGNPGWRITENEYKTSLRVLYNGVYLGPPPAASDAPYVYSSVYSKNYREEDRGIDFTRNYDYETVMAWSGSSRFGDDVGADYHPRFGFPGEPFGGRPAGTWIHYGRLTARHSNDEQLLNALGSNDFASFRTLFEGEFGGRPIEEPFGDARGF